LGLVWTKLELESPTSGEVAKIQNEEGLKAIGEAWNCKSAVEIVADYNGALLKHLIKQLDDQYGKILWRTLPITLVVTVPAVWSDAAKDRTMRAISQGGFNKTELPQLERTITVTEPEAAALYTISSYHDSIKQDMLAIGDGFIVLDMGGGTVDLITYVVSRVDPISLEEITVGTGAQCGATFVERAFLHWLEQKIGLANFVMIAGSPAVNLPFTALPKSLWKLVRDFVDDVKCQFDGSDTSYILSLPGPLFDMEDQQRGISGGEIRLNK
jgi:hypothetical protein